ncbi:hypothetical protein QYM36_016175 [Artemia franciscana]|uniref:PH domain-containing protein n=1 Tax=Artemia franciscana TaxID=6661 RepID=A0AA88L359_ARTSF|nr:hypothetical protein QYM36_016175 [Artemia franciscana]
MLMTSDQTHEEYSGLEKAYNGMLDVAEYINEVKRDNETIQIINDIQASISDLEMPEGTTLKDYGRLLRDGEIKIKCHDENNRIKPRMKSLRFQYKLDDDELEKDLSSVYDLTDLEDSEDEWKPPKGDDEDYSDDEFDSVCRNEDRLRIAHYLTNELESMPKSKKKKTKAAESEQYIFKHSLPLQHYRVEDPPVRKVTALGRESRWTHQFILAHRQSKNAYTLFAKTEEMKKKWIRALYDAL